MQKLLKEVKLKRFKIVTIQINNQKTIVLIKNSEFHVCIKYIDICHYFIRKVKSHRLIHLDYILTSDIIINRLTKSLLTLKFTYFINLISLINHWQRFCDLMIEQLRFQYLKDTYLNWVKDILILSHWLLELIRCYEILFFISSHCCWNSLRKCIKTPYLISLS